MTLVLIADDYDGVTETLSELIEDATGFSTVIARNGQEAVDLAHACDLDVALLDIDMPVLDGIEAARQIRLMGLDPSPFLIAHTGGLDTERAKQSGVFDFVVQKPADMETLLALIGITRAQPEPSTRQ